MRQIHAPLVAACVGACVLAASCGTMPTGEPEPTGDPGHVPEARVGPARGQAPGAVPEVEKRAAGVPVAAQPPSGKPVKVYIVAGQSNAELRGNIQWTQKNWPEYAKVREKLWHYRPGKKPPSPFLGETYDKFGVEFVAGMEISDAVENDVIFMTSAVGGTTLTEVWRPPSSVKRLGGAVGRLYTRLMHHTFSLVTNIEELYPRYRGQGFELAGLVWFQGENDAFHNFPYYQDLLVDFINDVRRDMGVPDLPFFIVKINDAWCGEGGEVIRRANEHVAHTMENVETIHTHDLHPKAHYNTQSYVVISQRLARVMVPYARMPVHVGTDSVKAAAARFYRSIKEPVRTHDMSSLEVGLVDYWKFDEMTAASSVSGARGVLVEDAEFGRPRQITGKFGKAIKLNGGQQIKLPGYRDVVNAEGMIEQLSVAFWAKNFGGAGLYRIGKGEGKPFDQKYDGDGFMNWFWSKEANKCGWDVRGFSKGDLGITTSVLHDGVQRTHSSFSTTGFSGNGVDWVHVAVVYDGLNGELRTYVNGKQVSYKRSTDRKYASSKHRKRYEGIMHTPVAPIIEAPEQTLTVGGKMLAEAEFQSYDELAIWSRALTEEEARKLYNGGAGSEIPVGVRSASGPDKEAR